jgi:hypothetical protein
MCSLSNQKEQDEKEMRLIEFAKRNLKKEFYVGTCLTDFNNLYNIIKDATPNENSNDFPDFVSHNSFIEIFDVSSSEQKKGSEQSMVENTTFSYQRNKTKDNEGSSIRSTSVVDSGRHTISKLRNSIEKNVTKHLHSLNKSQQKYETSIFYLDYSNDISYLSSYLEAQETEHGSYRLSNDLIMLKRLKEILNHKIDYVLFLTEINSEYQIEIININEIDLRINYLQKLPLMIVVTNFVYESFGTIYLGNSEEIF